MDEPTLIEAGRVMADFADHKIDVFAAAANWVARPLRRVAAGSLNPFEHGDLARLGA